MREDVDMLAMWQLADSELDGLLGHGYFVAASSDGFAEVAEIEVDLHDFYLLLVL